ncbi:MULTISPECIES: hypothetical protein [Flavobacterium]|uniref:Uncharacterized protein n=1 Tax=Flavobacterium salmonis TaxID=2654844 RepID=A0A6V6YR90_9FLAO|nr:MULTISPECIES: hypothetical protein [Flavobacterium]OOV20348.1 hypothetical protein BXU10_12290 [Flavobacterium sp. LM4]CAD0001980.1 hypothetical protein FLAT13_00840 [Flavobacterium salmonis]
MTEKNYDPDNENCPEKDMVENIRNLKINSEKNKNAQTAEEFINDSPNRTTGKNRLNTYNSDYNEEKINR